ncbi:MAG TPA: hypothetical protein VFB82_10225, partial [Blastocatellia bacterium]|nr:hypothetical protein [Blastocatellia bacterium]
MRMKRSMYSITLALAVFALLSMQGARAQGPQDQPDLTIDATTRSSVIESALKNLNANYVFPETAKKMEQAVRERIAR